MPINSSQTWGSRLAEMPGLARCQSGKSCQRHWTLVPRRRALVAPSETAAPRWELSETSFEAGGRGRWSRLTWMRLVPGTPPQLALIGISGPTESRTKAAAQHVGREAGAHYGREKKQPRTILSARARWRARRLALLGHLERRDGREHTGDKEQGHGAHKDWKTQGEPVRGEPRNPSDDRVHQCHRQMTITREAGRSTCCLSTHIPNLPPTLCDCGES